MLGSNVLIKDSIIAFFGLNFRNFTCEHFRLFTRI